MVMFSTDGQFMVQVQESRFHLNWRKARKDIEYPRFPAIYERFNDVFRTFSEFLKTEGIKVPKISRYELTYINELDSPAKNDVRSLQQYVKMFDWGRVQPSFLPEPLSVSAAWVFDLPDGKGQMNVSENRARRPDGWEGILLTLACSGSTSETYGAESWFSTAHEWIVRGFTDITTTEAQQQWQREV
jgi:uncharacterized protein (TIGR04255 family)